MHITITYLPTGTLDRIDQTEAEKADEAELRRLLREAQCRGEPQGRSDDGGGITPEDRDALLAALDAEQARHEVEIDHDGDDGVPVIPTTCETPHACMVSADAGADMLSCMCRNRSAEVHHGPEPELLSDLLASIHAAERGRDKQQEDGCGDEGRNAECAVCGVELEIEEREADDPTDTQYAWNESRSRDWRFDANGDAYLGPFTGDLDKLFGKRSPDLVLGTHCRNAAMDCIARCIEEAYGDAPGDGPNSEFVWSLFEALDEAL